MDRLESLGNQLSQITLYDIKSMYTQAKNVVLNISEMEAKVREATNDDSWGASSTLMQEIAQGTFNFQQFNEIMPCIYARFMEKEARQWRQIYKSLQLLEYLIKHGSERVVDDARSHIGTLKMLRSFHYIDEKGKDEGVNVRTRAKELVELLSDVEKIRTERRKAKANKSKYIGVGNDGGYGMSLGSGSGGRYGGFGSDSWGGGSGGFSSGDYYGNSGGFSDSGGSRRQYEEYNAGDDETVPSGSRSSSTATSHRTTGMSGRSPPARKGSAPTTVTPAPAPAPVPNLLDFDDDVAIGSTTTTTGNQGLATNKALPKPVVAGLDDDDFDDFQTAPVQTGGAQAQVPAIQSPTTAGPAQVSPSLAPIGQQQQQAKPNLMQLLNSTPLSPTTTTQQQPQAQTGFGGGMGMGIGIQQQQQQGHRATGSMGGLFGGGGVGGMRASGPTSPLAMGMGGVMQPTAMGNTPMRSNTGVSPVSQSQGQKKTATGGGGGGGGFDDLWNLSLASSSGKTSNTGSGTTMKSMKDIQKENASADLWGGAGGRAASGLSGRSGPVPGGFGTGRSAGGGDDLLL